MITVSTTQHGEAADLRDLMEMSLPAAWDYRIYLNGAEFAARERTPPAVRSTEIPWGAEPETR